MNAGNPLARLIQARSRELGLTAEGLGVRLGYQNPAKAAGRVQALCDGHLTSPPSRFALSRLAAALELPPETVEAEIRATEAVLAERARERREQELAALEAANAVWRANFRPHAILSPPTPVPAEHSTIPSLVIPHYIEGVTPLSARLDSLTAFSAKQFAYYTVMGVADPSLGPYEALGLGFSDTVQFAQRFAAHNDTTFISDNYFAAFDRSATAAQVDHFQKQIDYFTRLYVGVGIDASVAHNHARGAALGQIFGFSVKEAGNGYFDAATAFLLDASDGSVNYGTSLMNWG